MTERTTAELVTELGTQTARLVRNEIWLAKQEMTEKAKRAGTGAGLLGGAAVIVIYAVGVLILAVIAAFDLAMPLWAAALVTAAILIVLAVIAGLIGRAQLRRAVPPVPTEAVENIKQDVASVKQGVQGRVQ
jgi:uncharacterized membrane protein YqjE